ncbi:MAG: molybdopterin molybdotransferase MoeA [Acidobacteriota bacterium]
MALLPVDEALAILERAVPGPEGERIPWTQALGRVLLEPAAAAWDDPPFCRSSMDGYAVRVAGAVQGATLPVASVLFAGDMPREPLSPGTAAKIMTGAQLPPGAEAVIPVEDTEALEDGSVRLLRGVKPGENIRRQGENARKGEVVFGPGRRLDALDVAAGNVLGIAAAVVAKRPTAKVVATGSELCPPGSLPAPGAIVDANGPLLASLLEEWGARVEGLVRVGDEEGALAAALGEGLAADLLVVTGGVSAGDRDLVPALLRNLGATVLFHKVAMKPGKPILLATAGKTVILCLPGNPVSAFVGAHLFLNPAVRLMTGLPPRPWTRALLARERPRPQGPRTGFEPAVGLEEGKVALLPHRGSADLPAWREAAFLARIPGGSPPLPAGTALDVLPLGRGKERL